MVNTGQRETWRGIFLRKKTALDKKMNAAKALTINQNCVDLFAEFAVIKSGMPS